MTSTPTDLTSVRQRLVTPGLLVVLALLSAIAPFATDLYLPSFPQMTSELSASATEVQLSLTAFLVGIAVGQLIFGPLSDRFGRMRPLVIGAAVCLLASVATALAPTIGVLVAARLVQGCAGAAGMVIGRAVISDLARGVAAARAFSLMMIVGGVAPIIAPLLGSVFSTTIGWRGSMWFITALVLVMLVSVLVVVRETHSAERRAAAREARTGGGAIRELAQRAFIGNVVAFAFGFAVMMAYISASPFVYQTMIGLTPVQYAIAFGINAIGLVSVSALSARLARTVPVQRLLDIGLALILVATLLLHALVLISAPLWLLALPIFVAVASLGLVMGNATAGALSAVPTTAGLGSALLGALQFGVGALVSPLVSVAGETSAFPLAVIMATCAVIAALGYLAARSRTARTGAASRP
ncbi:multidrug effflux MFS transporter [Cnuibacter physcomitrellae]|uniref:multidrug effflux MFS transporter n=1 Tax=Cnuibacter physcomitrellae TaxID=1619308 RepID=UPI00217612B8|nr:multidrug effflux MFS transporter [Cnuibacter physcomitrellae]MCS5497424.1 multidrug effflux MFS transporter [Cnuibacter physcomitrellae]